MDREEELMENYNITCSFAVDEGVCEDDSAETYYYCGMSCDVCDQFAGGNYTNTTDYDQSWEEGDLGWMFELPCMDREEELMENLNMTCSLAADEGVCEDESPETYYYCGMSCDVCDQFAGGNYTNTTGCMDT